MKCKLATKTKGCFLKACNKVQWCRYEPWNAPPAGLSEARTKRKMEEISALTLLIFQNTPSYEAGYKAGWTSPHGSRAFDIAPLGYNSDERRAYCHGIKDALVNRTFHQKDFACRVRWEKGAVRRGELSESEREYTYLDEVRQVVKEYSWWEMNNVRNY